jgi:hypothetical protein
VRRVIDAAGARWCRIARVVTGGVTDDVTGGAMDGITGGVTDDVTGGAMGGITGGVTDDVILGVTS